MSRMELISLQPVKQGRYRFTVYCNLKRGFYTIDGQLFKDADTTIQISC